MKPHIKKYCEMWSCGIQGQYMLGKTPVDAYNRWKRVYA